MIGFNAAQIAKIAFISAFAAFIGVTTSRTANATVTPGFTIFVDIKGVEPQKPPNFAIVPETLTHSRSLNTPLMTTFRQTKEYELVPRSSEQLILTDRRSDVTTVFFSPDGSLVASASGDKSARVWDLDRKQLTKLSPQTWSVNSIHIRDRFAKQINEIIAKNEPRPPLGEDFCAASACVAADSITTGTKQHPIATGTKITSGFGWRSRPVPPGSKRRSKRQFHAGVDFAAPMGTPVRAIAFGVVVKIGGGNSCPDFGSSSAKLGCGGQLGNWIDIRHSDGTVSRYGHLQQGSIVVRKGKAVSAGQAIGAVGNSGYSTGPHLDFRLHNGKGYFFDPTQVIPY